MSMQLIFSVILVIGIMIVVLVMLANNSKIAAKRAKKIVGSQKNKTQIASDLNTTITNSLKNIENIERKRRKHMLSLGGRLEQAGLSKLNPILFIFSCILLMIIAGAAGYMIKQIWWMGLLTAFIVGIGFPLWLLNFLKQKHQKKFITDFVSAVEMMARGVKSGTPLEDVIRSIKNDSEDPLKTEFRILLENESVGISIDEGFMKMYERIQILEINLLATILFIQKKTGGNLVEALEGLSTVMRQRRLLEEKMSVLSADAKNSANVASIAPIAVCFLVGKLSPGFFDILFSKTAGKLVLIVCVLMILVGNIAIRKMAKVKF